MGVVADQSRPLRETTYFWPREHPEALQNFSCLILSYTRPISHHRGQERHKAQRSPSFSPRKAASQRLCSFLVEWVIELLTPLAPRAAKQHADHNPSSSTFLRTCNTRCTPTALCFILHHLRAHLQPALDLAHARSWVSEWA